MRKWGDLSVKKKLRRAKFSIKAFIRRKIWGDYKYGGICGAYHWVRCHVWNRYHVINLSGEDGYKWGYIDRDYAMFLACFKLLVEFVELEKPFEWIDWDVSETRSEVAREIKELYGWWKYGRAVEQKDAYMNYELAQKLEGKEDEMLIRLMKIRRYLWT